MTTVEQRKQSNRDRYGIDASQYTDDEIAVIDCILKVAENVELLTKTKL